MSKNSSNLQDKQLTADKLTKSSRERWLEQNGEALQAYNQRVEKRGVFSDGLRTF